MTSGRRWVRETRLSRIIGIDLGTTNSLVAYVDDATRLPRVIPDGEGRKLLPSVVAFAPEGILVGEAARRQLLKPLRLGLPREHTEGRHGERGDKQDPSHGDLPPRVMLQLHRASGKGSPR